MCSNSNTLNYNLHCNLKRVPGMWHVEDVGDVILTVFVCNAIYVKDVEDRSNTPKCCNAMSVEDVEDGKRTYRHIFIITFLIWYRLNVMLSMSKMSKIDQIYLRAVMLCMSKMSKIDQMHLRAVMLCMSKMSKIDQIHLRAVLLCMSKMRKEHTHTFWLITSLILNGFSIRKKFWKAETYGFPTIPSNPMYVEACRRCWRLSLTSSTCFNIHSVLRHCFDLLYSIQCIQCYVSQHLQHQTMCIDTYWHAPFNVHTTDKVSMGDNGCEWVASSLSNSK